MDLRGYQFSEGCGRCLPPPGALAGRLTPEPCAGGSPPARRLLRSATSPAVMGLLPSPSGRPALHTRSCSLTPRASTGLRQYPLFSVRPAPGLWPGATEPHATGLQAAWTTPWTPLSSSRKALGIPPLWGESPSLAVSRAPGRQPSLSSLSQSCGRRRHFPYALIFTGCLKWKSQVQRQISSEEPCLPSSAYTRT